MVWAHITAKRTAICTDSIAPVVTLGRPVVCMNSMALVNAKRNVSNQIGNLHCCVPQGCNRLQSPAVIFAQQVSPVGGCG